MRHQPKIIFDTNVCDTLRESHYNSVRKRISQEFRIVVSPNTFVELLHGIKGAGTEEHFEIRKKRIRVMTGNGHPVFLLFPGQFALRYALQMDEAPVPGAIGPKEFQLWHRVVMNAKSRSDLAEANVELPLRHQKRFGFNVDTVEENQAAGIRFHRIAMEQIRDGRSNLGSSMQWAAMLAVGMGRELTEEQAITLAQHLEAAYQYEAHLCELVKNGRFNFENHRGDWIDMQQ